MNKKTVVLGASDNPARYSYLAMNRLKAAKHDIVAIGKKETIVGDIVVHSKPVAVENVDTVTLYLNPANQKNYYDYILSLHPKRIIFNPGTENEELATLAEEHDIQTMEACTLVLLSTGQY
ncbi:MAG: CoA-binding protein [Agriterribacter sp.]